MTRSGLTAPPAGDSDAAAPCYDGDRYKTARLLLRLLGGKEFIYLTGSEAVYLEGCLRIRLSENRLHANFLTVTPATATSCIMRFTYHVPRRISIRQDRKWAMEWQDEICRVVAEIEEELPCLRSCFEESTGLYTSLYPREDERVPLIDHWAL